MIQTMLHFTYQHSEYPSWIFNKSSLILLLLVVLGLQVASATSTIETITYKDSDGVENVEHAFRAPMSGVPKPILELFCANNKLRLYWDVFREQVLLTTRNGIFLRRMARFARHAFEDVRQVDKPFNATMLSRVDDYFAVKDSDEDELELHDDKVDKGTAGVDNQSTKSQLSAYKRFLSSKFKMIGHAKRQLVDKLSKEQLEALDESVKADDQITKTKGLKEVLGKIKSFVQAQAPKVAMGIYTRWRLLWWMVMPCAFVKYYLWDIALDDFTKLKRSLLMYPDIQLMRLQDLECKPVRFFKRILDVCKILNPLLNFSFGQLALDKVSRFKADIESY